MTDQNPAELWMNFLRVEYGDQVVVIPNGAMSGQMIQGELLGLAFNSDDHPVAIQLRSNELMPPVTVLWQSILMITVPGAVKSQPDASDIDLAAVVASMDEQGVPVPQEVRDALARQTAAEAELHTDS